MAVLMTYSTGMVSNDSRCVKRIVKPPPPHHPNEWLMVPALEGPDVTRASKYEGRQPRFVGESVKNAVELYVDIH
jgi:hypothetical protein